MPEQILEASIEAAGQRLDHFLGTHLPDMGLRGRRRLVANGLILVNGRTVAASYRLRPGDSIRILDCCRAETGLAAIRVKLLASQGEYHFFYKPAGLHTVALAGKPGRSLEGYIESGKFAPYGDAAGFSDKPVILMQRLDYGTSGIVCGVTDMAAAREFRLFEANGQCRKYYAALLTGILQEKTCVTLALNCGKGRKVRVTGKVGDASRATVFTPVTTWRKGERIPPIFENWARMSQGDALTLALCKIQRGQRHQIRAHANAIGHALAGDELYGGYGSGGYFLQHICLSFPNHILHYMEKELAGILSSASSSIQKWREICI